MKARNNKDFFHRITKFAKKTGIWQSEKKNIGTHNNKNYFSYIHNGKASWNLNNYSQFAKEGYIKNVIAHRCINLISKNAANVKWQLYRKNGGKKFLVSDHLILQILNKPNFDYIGSEFFEAVYISKLISGNAFIRLNLSDNNKIASLDLLKSDQVEIITDHDDRLIGYRYKNGNKFFDYPVGIQDDKSLILHLKNFHPLDKHYGLSPMEAAAYSIDQHNNAAEWNQSLLQNSARPSGALVLKSSDGNPYSLSEEQYHRLKQEIDAQYSGIANSGRPMLLEGGLEWHEIGLSPKDMDFMEAKYSAARDIAMAFGVPSQLVGIPGESTYNNMTEARLILWEQTIVPMIDNLRDNLNNWLLPHIAWASDELEINYDKDSIIALSPRRDELWRRIDMATFLTQEEKRSMVGLSSSRA